MKNPINVQRGKKARTSGRDLELRVRKDLEEKGWIVDKWGNNVEFVNSGSISDFIFQCKTCGIVFSFLADYNGMNVEELRRSEERVIRQIREHNKDHKIEKIAEGPECQKFGKLIQAKNKWAGPGRPMMMGAGFPDFLCFRGINIKKYLLELSNQMCKENIGIQNLRRTASFKSLNEIKNATLPTHEVIGVEVKTTGYLTQLEKEKCQWYLDNQVFSKILIASKYKEKNRVKIKYEDFLEKYG